jgi:hypothetical protein
MASYLPYEPQQQMLLPEALQDWLPEEHLAYFISDAVDGLDLSAFHERYAGGGSRIQPFHPAMMVKVLVYAYATGVFSSRKIARRRRVAGDAEGRRGEPWRAAATGARGRWLPFGGVLQALAECGTELVVALGREGKQQLHSQTGPRTAEVAAKLQSDAGKQAYRRRKWIAEPPNGWIKSVLGFRQFSMRGLHRVKAEWKLVCMALNLRRMRALQAR